MNKEQQELLDEAYENYCKSFENQTLIEEYSFDTDPMTKFMFIDKCKTDSEFSEKWSLKIEERELSLEERMKLWNDKVKGFYIMLMWGFGKTQEDALDEQNIPTKIINISYNDKKIESYE